MINSNDFKDVIYVTKTDKVITIPLFNRTFNRAIENTMYIEVYSDVNSREQLFQTDNIATIPVNAKSIKLDLSFLKNITVDTIIIVVGVAGSFSKKYLLRIR